MKRIKVIVQRKRVLYYWRIVAGNGKTLAHSEVYSTRGKTLQTAQSLAELLGCEVEIR